MYIVNVPIQIKEGFKEQFVTGIKENASHAQNDEPGCLPVSYTHLTLPTTPYV